MPLTRTDLKEVMEEVLASGMMEEHVRHHDWISAQIRKEEKKAEFWANLAAKSLPALVWSGLAGAAAGIWNLVKNHWHW